jgi:hypothetical protein
MGVTLVGGRGGLAALLLAGRQGMTSSDPAGQGPILKPSDSSS